MTARWPLPTGLHRASTRLPVEGQLPSFDGATGWLNSPPLTEPDLRGKVVMINFWTYTCVNWLRQLPYVRAWAEKYSGQGLVVIGVHTPEFSFEHDGDNVRWAVRQMRHRLPGCDRQRLRDMACLRQPLLARPVLRRRAGTYPASPVRGRRIPAVGNDHPAAAGRGRLRDQPRRGFGRRPWRGSPGRLGHPEITGKLHGLRTHRKLRISRAALLPDKPASYTIPTELRLNDWALSGNWTMEQEATRLNTANGQLAYRFHARDLNLVMGPAVPGTSVRFTSQLDGDAPRAAQGSDVDADGDGMVVEQRLYQLIRQPGPVTEHTFEITFLDPDVAAYVFTFG